MHTFKLVFIGREAGAIGIAYRVEKTLPAQDAAAARLKLYDTHEHVIVISCEKLQAPPLALFPPNRWAAYIIALAKCNPTPVKFRKLEATQ